jgi:hypothetical protein
LNSGLGKNKIKFNDTKSKVLLVTRKKNIENQDINIYLNNRTIEQVKEKLNTLEYI